MLLPILVFFLFNSNAAETINPTQDKSKSVTNIDQLAADLAKALDVEKNANLSSQNGQFMLRKAPFDNDPLVQKKITELYAIALREYDLLKPKLRAEITEEFAAELKKQFSEEELKYLIVLSKYKPFLKLKTFMMSDRYQDIYSKPALKAIEIAKNLNEKIIQVHNSHIKSADATQGASSSGIKKSK